MDEVVQLKALCFDLQRQNAELMGFLSNLAQVLEAKDINNIYPEIVRLKALVDNKPIDE